MVCALAGLADSPYNAALVVQSTTTAGSTKYNKQRTTTTAQLCLADSRGVNLVAAVSYYFLRSEEFVELSS